MRGFSSIGLVNPKTPANLGSVLRAAYAFDAALVVLQGRRMSPDIGTNTPKGHRHLPLVRVEDVFDACPHGAVPVAVELCDGAISLEDFCHPTQAFYIFGPEDGSIPPAVLDRCRHKVIIPSRVCLNLACAVNIVLYDRAAKALIEQKQRLYA